MKKTSRWGFDASRRPESLCPNNSCPVASRNVTTSVRSWFGRDERPPTSGVSPILADRTHVRGWRARDPVRTTLCRPRSRCGSPGILRFKVVLRKSETDRNPMEIGMFFSPCS